MELDITRFVALEEPSTYSASAAELGPDAGRITWNNAKQHAAECAPLLDTPEKVEAFNAHVRGFGAWDDEEIEAWDDSDREALLAQLIAGDMREGDITPGMSEAEWAAYEAQMEAGKVSGRLYRGGGGRVYYYLGS